jgi:hypothetical protein
MNFGMFTEPFMILSIAFHRPHGSQRRARAAVWYAIA